MDRYITTLVTYIEKTLGLVIKTREWRDGENLPLLLREKYFFQIIRISDSECLVFIENSEGRSTPGIISKHCNMLTQYWNGGIIYSKNNLSSIDRTRLIQAKIPFIIPDRQLYLPFMGMDLKEIFPPEKIKIATLSPSAQVLILGKLYKKDWIHESPSRMSGTIGLSKMSIGRAFSELELHNIAFVKTSGKTKVLEFNLCGNELWNSTLHLLKSPVTSAETMPFHAENNLIIAGESALSRYTMINEPDTSTFAVCNRAKNLLFHTAMLKDNPNREMVIQKWAYDPRILSRKGIADPLSVYLEFKDSDDERIEEALEDLLRDIQW